MVLTNLSKVSTDMGRCVYIGGMNLLRFFPLLLSVKQFSRIVPIVLKKVPIMLTLYKQCACTLHQSIYPKNVIVGTCTTLCVVYGFLAKDEG